MKVTVARVHENLFNGEAESVHVPTTAGELTILGHHEPLVSTLKAGTVTVHTKEGDQSFPVESGVLEVSSDQATILL